MTHTVHPEFGTTPLSELHIITNNVPRFIIDAYELTPTQRERFDYIDWDAVEQGTASFECFEYRGELYDLNDGWPCPRPLSANMIALPADHPFNTQGWDGYQSDSFFSGLLIKYPREEGRYGDEIDTERVIVGRYYN